MKEDNRLKKVCKWVFIVSMTVLIGVIITQVCMEDTNKFVGFWKILITIIITLSSGIFGSAFVLWLSKKFDYNTKKEELLYDYYNTALRLKSSMIKIKLFIKGISFEEVRESYITFESKIEIWNELRKIKNAMCFSDKDEQLNCLIEKIHSKIEDYISVICANYLMLKDEDYVNNNKDAVIRAINMSQKKIFTQKKLYRNVLDEQKGTFVPMECIEYYSIIEQDLYPLFNELQKKVVPLYPLINFDCPVIIIINNDSQ